MYNNFEPMENSTYSREVLPNEAHSNVEKYLRELCLLEGSPLPVPKERIEKILNVLVGGVGNYEQPISREEKLIHAIIVDDDRNIEIAQSRVEVLWYILLKDLNGEDLLGMNVNGKIVEDCFSRIESYLWYLIKHGGIGSEVEYQLNDKVTMYNTKAKKVNEGTVEGNTMVNIVGDEVINTTINSDDTLSEATYEAPALQTGVYTVCNDGSDFKVNGVNYSHGITEQTFVNTSTKVIDIPNGYSVGGFEKLEIQGETLENILPDPTLRNSMENKSMQKFNDGYDTVNVVDGVAKSAILKGQTLVNLAPISYNFAGVNLSDEVTLKANQNTANADSRIKEFNIVYDLKPNTTYALSLFITELQNINGLHTYLTYNTGEATYGIVRGLTSVGRHIVTFTTDSRLGRKLGIYLSQSNDETISAKIKEVMLFEYQDGMENWDIPYFEGMESVQAPVVTMTGKNIFDGEMELGGLNPDTGENTVTGSCVRSKNYIKVKSNTNYTFSNNKGYSQLIFELDENKKVLSAVSRSSFTTKANTKYLRFRTSTGALQNDVSVKYQIEEGTVATSYEPYKSNILSTPSDLVLGGIGVVQDTLDLVTGEMVQRINEVTLDGTLAWSNNDIWSVGDYYACYTRNITDKKGGVLNLVSNQYQTKRDIDLENNSVALSEFICGEGSNHVIYVVVAKSKLTADINGDYKASYIEYLKNNPVTVQYELATPIIKTVDLSIVDQDGNIITELHSFNDGHIQVSSEALLPSVDYEVSTNNSYHLDLAKTSTQYTMKSSSASGNFTIDGTQYELGTNNTFITPSTMPNKLMMVNGSANDCMIIEGDITAKSLPYFKGIKSAFENVNQIEVLSTDGTNFTKAIITLSSSLKRVGDVKDTISISGTTATITRRIADDLTVLETPTIETQTIEIKDQDGNLLPELSFFEDGHIFINGDEFAPTTVYKPNIDKFKGTINVSTVTSREIISSDPNIVIVKGNRVNEVISTSFKGMKHCINPTITFYNEDKSQHNELTVEETLCKIPNYTGDIVDIQTKTNKPSCIRMIFNNAETWNTINMASQTNTIAFSYDINLDSNNTAICTYNNLFGDYKANDLYITDVEGVCIYDRKLCLRINRNRLESEDVTGLSGYLLNHPLEVLIVNDVPEKQTTLTGELTCYDGITITEVTSEELNPYEVTLDIPVTNVEDIEAIINDISLVSESQETSSERILVQETDIAKIKNGLNEIENIL